MDDSQMVIGASTGLGALGNGKDEGVAGAVLGANNGVGLAVVVSVCVSHAPGIVVAQHGAGCIGSDGVGNDGGRVGIDGRTGGDRRVPETAAGVIRGNGRHCTHWRRRVRRTRCPAEPQRQEQHNDEAQHTRNDPSSQPSRDHAPHGRLARARSELSRAMRHERYRRGWSHIRFCRLFHPTTQKRLA